MPEFTWSDIPCANGHIGWRRLLDGTANGVRYRHTKCEQCRKDNRAKHRHKDRAAQIRNVINGRLRSLLLGRKRRKQISVAEEYLGCTIEFYKSYIELQFTDDMTWENWGQLWEIDHLRPCHTFDLHDPVAVKKCFSYKNTRPLEKLKNTWNGKKVST